MSIWGDDATGLRPAGDPVEEAMVARRGTCHWCNAPAVFELMFSTKSSGWGSPIFHDTRLACAVHHDDPGIYQTRRSILIQRRRLA